MAPSPALHIQIEILHKGGHSISEIAVYLGINQELVQAAVENMPTADHASSQELKLSPQELLKREAWKIYERKRHR